MTTSLALLANNGISVLEHLANEPTVIHVYRGHQPTRFLAQQIPVSVAASPTQSVTTAHGAGTPTRTG